MKKVLFVANSDRHIKLCHLPYMKMFQDNGYQVHVATNSLEEIPYCDKKIDLKLRRNPYSLFNFVALRNVRELVKNEKYDLISCHTPVGGFLGRCSVVGRRRKIDTRVFYMAHGFHFFKKSGTISWMLYYPLEKFLSRFSDAVITMNEEITLMDRIKKLYRPVGKITDYIPLSAAITFILVLVSSMVGLFITAWLLPPAQTRSPAMQMFAMYFNTIGAWVVSRGTA